MSNLKPYKKELREALDNTFLRTAMDNFAVAYPTGRANAFNGMDIRELFAEIAEAKDKSIARMDELYTKFKANAEQAGVTVHLAKDAAEANSIIAEIAKENGCKKAVKSKSMTSEEIQLNHHLEDQGVKVVETDLGEWIIQLRHEGPSHMVMPAIHLSRGQVAGLFTQVTGTEQTEDIEKLVKVARRQLRQEFIEADMGISGVNFAVADTGSIGIVTNEGNARLVTTLPRVHVALAGLDKLTPDTHEALRVLHALPRNATGQAMTSYVTWIHGAGECQSSHDGKKNMHIVFLDNGRREIARDPDFAQVLRCIRCGACANVCPVFRMVGGHKFGHIYIGAIGLILTYFFHGHENASKLVQNCINCMACKSVCAASIDLPGLIKKIHARIQKESGTDIETTLMSMAMKNRRLFHGLLRSARFAQKAMGTKQAVDPKGGTLMRHLPMIFAKDQGFREIPVITDKPFRDRFKKIKPQVADPKFKVAIFAGCAQDFIYPEHLEAAVKLFGEHGVDVHFPQSQTCCGLPMMMMGQEETEKELAVQNLKAFEKGNYDYILTLCPSCASHLKNGYPKVFKDSEYYARGVEFSKKIIDYSSFVADVLQAKPTPGPTGSKAAYHAPCHLCRGLDVHEAPRKLIQTAGLQYVPSKEEEVCCGFGGSYSVKFPEVSEQILARKLKNVAESGAEMLVTDCPGCVMQLRGGIEKRGLKIKVRHMSEIMEEKE